MHTVNDISIILARQVVAEYFASNGCLPWAEVQDLPLEDLFELAKAALAAAREE